METEIVKTNTLYNHYYISVNQACDDFYSQKISPIVSFSDINAPESKLIVKKNIKRSFRYFYCYSICLTVTRRGVFRCIYSMSHIFFILNPNVPIESSYKNIFNVGMINNVNTQQFSVGVVVPFRNKALAVKIAKAKLKIHLEKKKKILNIA